MAELTFYNTLGNKIDENVYQPILILNLRITFADIECYIQEKKFALGEQKRASMKENVN